MTNHRGLRKHLSAGLLFSAAMLLACLRPAGAEVLDVWAVGDGEKVYGGQAEHPAMHGNSVWDGRTVRLRGLYNEVLAFQVIVRTDSMGARALEVSVEPPVHRSSGTAMAAGAGPAWGPRGWIEVFSQHYLDVDQPTNCNYFFAGDSSRPPRMEGLIPDALIPADALPGRGGFPVEVPELRSREVRTHEGIVVRPPPTVRNQGFWIDLYLPRDRSMPAGTYTGVVRVTEAGREVAVIGLEVELLPAFLPDENHSTVWLFSSDVREYFPGLEEAELTRMLKHSAHRHRIDLVGGFEAHSSAFDEAMMADYRPWLDGSAFTPEMGYHGPGRGEGEHLFAVGMYGSRVLGETRASHRRESDKWVRWFERNAPEVQYFWYTIDEPRESMYAWLRERAGWVQDNPGPGSRLPVFVTRGYIEQLDGAIDIWCSNRGVDPERKRELEARDRKYWFYNGHRPLCGAFILSAPAVDCRVNGWIKYLYGIDTWFLWHGTHWRHNGQGPKGRHHQPVFSEPATFINWGMNFVNGNGVLFYPGRMPFYPDEDRGLDRLLGSIRLKNIRRGQQDYELMWLAERKAGRERVLRIVRSVVPAAMKEVALDGPVPWPESGDRFDQARAKLLDIVTAQ